MHARAQLVAGLLLFRGLCRRLVSGVLEVTESSNFHCCRTDSMLIDRLYLVSPSQYSYHKFAEDGGEDGLLWFPGVVGVLSAGGPGEGKTGESQSKMSLLHWYRRLKC